jgi:hypothetical protein
MLSADFKHRDLIDKTKRCPTCGKKHRGKCSGKAYGKVGKDFAYPELVEKHGTKGRPGYSLLHPGTGSGLGSTTRGRRAVGSRGGGGGRRKTGLPAMSAKQNKAFKTIDKLTGGKPLDRKKFHDSMRNYFGNHEGRIEHATSVGIDETTFEEIIGRLRKDGVIDDGQDDRLMGYPVRAELAEKYGTSRGGGIRMKGMSAEDKRRLQAEEWDGYGPGAFESIQDYISYNLHDPSKPVKSSEYWDMDYGY